MLGFLGSRVSSDELIDLEMLIEYLGNIYLNKLLVHKILIEV